MTDQIRLVLGDGRRSSPMTQSNDSGAIVSFANVLFKIAGPDP